MFFEKIKNFLRETASGDLSFKEKIFTSLSIFWIILIGYLTWWNGLKGESLDKSFRWDEWVWFGLVPALTPFLFYVIWKKRD
tara:strand:- start:2277 stop:2522 length:246 start_codon:yes stop_codon:yes gene_type:complete